MKYNFNNIHGKMHPDIGLGKPRTNMLRRLIEDAVSRVIDEGWLRNCTNCEHWIGNTEQCALYKARPPAKVIVVGCESHSDLIPF